MGWTFKKSLWLAFWILTSLLSAGLIAYGSWVFQIERGSRFLREGDSLNAAEVFASAESPFRRFPWLAQLLSHDYQKLVFNQVAILYAQGDTEEVMEKLEEAAATAPFLAERGEYSFWTGNVYLRRAFQSKNPEASLDALKTARDEYQKGLIAQPDDWDLKYNYELVRYVLSQRQRDQKGEQEKVKSILEKMRPTVDPKREELPPAKRG